MRITADTHPFDASEFDLQGPRSRKSAWIWRGKQSNVISSRGLKAWRVTRQSIRRSLSLKAFSLKRISTELQLDPLPTRN